jgi:hypothetical protein
MTNPVMVVRRQVMHANIGDPNDETMVPVGRGCWMWCPGCDHAVCIPVVGEDGSMPRGPSWTWDGNLESPTFDPSILQHQGERTHLCHSYVRAGRWEFPSDSTHALTGQTIDMVPLPDWLVRD